MVGKQIKTVDRVFKLALLRKSAINIKQLKPRPIPAAILQHYPAILLYKMVKGGCLQEYKPKKH